MSWTSTRPVGRSGSRFAPQLGHGAGRARCRAWRARPAASSASSGLPVPPSASHVAWENWYLPRYGRRGDRGRDRCRTRTRRSGRGSPRGRRVGHGVSVLSAGVVRPSFSSVAGPATPSTFRPLRLWKRLIARRVFGPSTPSALMPSAFWIWRVVTFFGVAWVARPSFPRCWRRAATRSAPRPARASQRERQARGGVRT